MKFFKPNSEFEKILRKIRIGKRIVIDCGCGDGDTVDFINNMQGYKAIGIDLLNMSDRHDIVPLDARKFDFTDSHLPLIARPCRGDWTHETIDIAMLAGVHAVLYIGLNKWQYEDIEPLREKYNVCQLSKQPVGEDGEHFYWILPKGCDELPDELVQFCLVKASYWDDFYWAEDGGDCWINRNGGRCPKNEKDEVKEKVCATDEDGLDWTKTGMLRNQQTDCGWLSPKGEWYGCDSHGHDAVAHYIIKKHHDQLGEEGWLRVHSPSEHYQCGDHLGMTQEQMSWLLEHNHQLKEWEVN